MRTLDARSAPEVVEVLTKRRWEINRVIEEQVRVILDRVRREGDAALLDFTRAFDSPAIDTVGIQVSARDIDAAARAVSLEFLKGLRAAKRNIVRFHEKQRQKSWVLRGSGMLLEQKFFPLRRVGIYVPGGKAAYPSTVLMNAIPAALAGVKEIVMVTPCGGDGTIRPEVLAAARLCGVREIYRVGGAQAIAALAFGTGTIRPVDKITGPGNAYVAEAKRQVFGQVGIDMIAGPTEVVVVADRSANPDFIAADLIAQAEHDEEAQAICLTPDEGLVGSVQTALDRRIVAAPRRAIASRSLKEQGAFVLVKNLAQAAEIVNSIAPEHLEVMVRDPRRFVAKVRTAGAIFVGSWSSEAFGDYLAGPNHTLPTLGTARFSSALSVADFLRFTNIIEIRRGGAHAMSRHVEVLAAAEGLDGHAASARARRESA